MEKFTDQLQTKSDIQRVILDEDTGFYAGQLLHRWVWVKNGKAASSSHQANKAITFSIDVTHIYQDDDGNIRLLHQTEGHSPELLKVIPFHAVTQIDYMFADISPSLDDELEF